MTDSRFSTSHIELDEQALRQNIKFLRGVVGPGPLFSSVIKGNAYGHGISHFVPMAERCGVRHFSVFSADEAYLAYQASCRDSEIMIMGMVTGPGLKWAIEQEVSFFIFELERLNTAVRIAEKVGKKARIHIHLETGMNRLGLEHGNFEELIGIIHNHEENLTVEGLCTHYAGAESVSNQVRVEKQIDQFRQYVDWFADRGIRPKLKHTACSAAALNYPETAMDMVRIGIAQYGFWPNRETFMNYMKKNGNHRKRFEDPLKRVLSWKSQIMSIKKVEVGEFVGYGNTYLTSRDQRIASVPNGYAHGFGRNLTNVGLVLINGERAPVAGLVNMNMLTVDVTDIPHAEKGDEVVLIGHQGDQEMTVASFSEMTNNMNYEVLARLPGAIPRKIKSIRRKSAHTE
ncbi:MAG: alanine racemase [Balneolaceae bacterium]